MVDTYLAKYEGKELELFRSSSNPYETVSIRVQMDAGCMYLGDEETEHGPDYGHSIRIFNFDKDNTRKVFLVLSQSGMDPILKLKSMVDDIRRTQEFIRLCKENNIQYSSNLYF